MRPTNKYYVRELLERVKPLMIFKQFAGEWKKRDLPWLFQIWPFRKFIRQWELVPNKFPKGTGGTFKFRRYHEEETDSKND